MLRCFASLFRNNKDTSPAQDSGDDTVANYLYARLSQSKKDHATFKEIKALILQSDDWKDWWNYHATNWENMGWKNADEATLIMLTDDIHYLFADTGLPLSAHEYEAITNFHLRNIKKVDINGNFLPYAGSSIVAMLDHTQFGWHDLHSQLMEMKEIQKYFALLPAESWHITLSDNSPHVTDTTVGHVHKRLGFKIKDIYTQGVLLLAIELVEDDSDEQDFTSAKSSGANCASSKYLHISLGYQNRALPIHTSRVLRQKIDALLHKHNCYNTTHAVLTPALHQFTSMSQWSSIAPTRRMSFLDM